MLKKIDNRACIIKRLAGTKFGRHPSQLLTVYKASIRRGVTQSPSHSIWSKEWQNLQHKYENTYNKNVNPTYESFIKHNSFYTMVENTKINPLKNEKFDINIDLHEEI